MAACLWCQAELHVAAAVCPTCGKRQADHPSMPGLDLPGGSARPAASRPVSASGPSRSPSASGAGGGGATFDLEDFSFPDDGPALETELDDLRSKVPSVVPAAPPPPPPASASPAAAAAPDHDQIAALAAFGAVPTSWWEPAAYVYRVKMRQAELGRLLAERRGLAAKADAAVEDALSSFADTVRPAAQKLGAYAQAVRDLEEAEQRLRREDGALAAAMDAHHAKLAEFDQRILPLQKELEACKAQVAEAQAIHSRTEAMQKRAEIEARNAAARAAADGAADRVAREQLSRATGAFTDAGERLTAARRKASTTQERLLDAKNARAAADAQFKRGGEARTRGVGEARKRHRAASAGLADRALADTATFGSDHADTRRQVEKLREAQSARALDVTVCELAMRSYDPDAFKRGMVIVAIVAGAFVLLLGVAFYAVALSGGASVAPPPALPAVPDVAPSG